MARSRIPPGIRVDAKRDAATVHLSGALGMDQAPALRGVLMEALARTPRLHVNLSSLEKLDSAVLACLVEALQQARASGGDLHLQEAVGQPLKLLQLTRLDGVFGLDA